MLSQSGVFKFILFGIFACGIGVVILNVVSYGRRKADYDLLTKDSSSVLIPNGRRDEVTVRKTDTKLKNKLSQSTDKNIDTSKIPIRTYKIKLDNEKYNNVSVRAAGNGNNHILLLHGQKSSSEVWKRTGTLQYLASLGYQVYAIDIPHSRNDLLDAAEDKAPVQWLTKVIDKLRLSSLVIVSPSLSGRLTLPYMFQLKNNQNLVKGFVYIAPIGTKQYEPSAFKQVKFPTLIVHGANDKQFQKAFQTLKTIPNSVSLLIEDAAHNSYIDKPAEFHNGLRRFLGKVYRHNQKVASTSLKKMLSSPLQAKKSPKKKKQ